MEEDSGVVTLVVVLVEVVVVVLVEVAVVLVVLAEETLGVVEQEEIGDLELSAIKKERRAHVNLLLESKDLEDLYEGTRRKQISPVTTLVSCIAIACCRRE